MKKFIDRVDNILDESLHGFALAHEDSVLVHRHPTFITRREPPQPGKVALISGGGSGHEPLHSGFVGYGMLDAACPGQIFTSPTPDQMVAAADATESGGGVLFVVKNYAGDVMNFEIASEMLECPVETVLVADDVSIPADHSAGRRGVAGTLVAEKIVGAAAEAGADLAHCKALGERVVSATASMGVALTSCTVPAVGKPTFAIAADEMELGVGIHGEQGRQRLPLGTATEVADCLCRTIEQELKPSKGQPVLLHVNGLGGTPLMELYLIYERARRYWEARGLAVARSLIGNYTTSLDMAGCSITVTLLDEILIQFWDAPVSTPSLRWGL